MSSSNIIHDTEVAVIGAGVVGCSIAYHLAERGAAVTVVEAETVGAGTSTSTLGLVWVQGKEPAEYMELNRVGARLHAQLAKKFDEDVGLRQPGGLVICLDEAELQAQVAANQRLAANGKYEFRVLTAGEVREMEPHVSAEIAGGVYSPYDGYINPVKLLSGLAQLAQRLGVRFLLHTPVGYILQNEARVTGVATAQGIVRARYVVVATGVWAPTLLEPLGIPLSLQLVRGQILVTAATPPFIHHPLGDVIRPTMEGNLMLGSTHEHVGLDKSITTSAARQILDRATRTVPILREVPIIRQFSGIRPIPGDGLPILGTVTSIEGLLVAVSHSGVTLAPVHGKVISELIVDGRTDVPLERYRPERFASFALADRHRRGTAP